MSPLERLIAIEDIKSLRARYSRHIDTKDWLRLRAVLLNRSRQAGICV